MSHSVTSERVELVHAGYTSLAFVDMEIASFNTHRMEKHIMEFRSAAETRSANITYHLVPVAYWQEHGAADHYVPAGFADDGFIHCTNGLDELVKVANLFYSADPREFQVMVLDVPRLTSELRYDDPDEVYPHIYGPLNTAAVIGSLPVRRSQDGTFVEIGTGK